MSILVGYAPVLPEILLAVGAMALLMLGAFGPDNEKSGEQITWLALLLIVAAAALIVLQPPKTEQLFEGAFVVDRFSRFIKLLVLLGSAGALLLSVDYLKKKRLMKFEYAVLVLLSTVGMMMMVSANDLIALYLGLELQSMALYVLASMQRENLRSSEAGLKYFVLGALASGMLLYGASLIYGFTGSTSFPVIAGVAQAHDAAQNVGLIVGLVFLLVGLAFKVSAVPFHMWTPDVYEGAPTPVTAFFASAPKIAAMALLMRSLGVAFPGLEPQWLQIIWFVAIASMLLGSFAAIGQTNIKRLMAYSSIGHVGFALVGLAAGTHEGAQAVLIYLVIYIVMTLGTFACILSMRRGDEMIEEIDQLSGLAQTNLPMAFTLGMLMFSLAGIPPLAGFFAKLYVFSAAVQAGLFPLAVIGVLASVVGAYYYIRIVLIMFVKDPEEKFAPVSGKLGFVMAASLVFIFVFATPFVGGLIVDAAGAAAKSLRF
ncbi:NADH-quinone oxidoreductase subunit N [Candidatus Filomicrobium marinum]|uniref:NADH-quinone oxidoreductase subunit N n=2 Tax=Filomicrobium TaxID=119044 RepID=A0A0D6JIM3_9HYPH|nr:MULTISPECIES: NADH-quinone oxidoreductase subunit NuoN [Filomicrobium]MCV0369411.1 NADH-quinone oxidoreductase subunit NuoN [Filomicrobium sp.]CFX42065.1 NADH-quinone oxidoreductase subunit N [Candidatus Filomicrobium marinum]CPR21125.1 NADH-quinone oxidoreductase subunit N [Candidatus Filomicrobium marinum]SDP23971.1 NADH dehydrogenase subunit N [Filomicrobium insigne]